jgi:hypothetical protein
MSSGISAVSDATGRPIMAKTENTKDRAGKTVINLKVTLRGTKPPVWRRLLVPGTMNLADLHQAIQAAMGWHDAHLHLFDIDGRQYGDRSTVDDVADETRLTLNGLLKSAVTRFAYIYDFGDNWEHTVVIEKARPATEAEALPACLAGKRACPPEDCGGPWGYLHLLEVLADPNHPDYDEQREWIDQELEPDAFQIDSADSALKRRFNRP